MDGLVRDWLHDARASRLGLHVFLNCTPPLIISRKETYASDVDLVLHDLLLVGPLLGKHKDGNVDSHILCKF